MDRQPSRPFNKKASRDKISQALAKNIEKLQAISKTESRRELLRHKIEIYKELSGYMSSFNPNLSVDDRSLTFFFDSHIAKHNSNNDDGNIHVSESNQNFFKELLMFFLKREPTQSLDDSDFDDDSPCNKRTKKINFHQP